MTVEDIRNKAAEIVKTSVSVAYPFVTRDDLIDVVEAVLKEVCLDSTE